jgi:uncharacterized protein YprB with RNaseH-like and TPR domain
MKCRECGSNRVYRDGLRYTAKGNAQGFQCRACGKKTQGSICTFEEERVGYLDIEASQLKSDFGIIYAWAIMDKGVGPISDVMKKRTLADEKRLITNLLNEMKKFDRLVTYYGTRFDVPFIRSRALYHGLEFPEFGSIAHEDLYFVARNRLGTLSSKRLENVTRFLGIEGKTPLDPAVWVAASLGDMKSMKYIHEHNVADVRILEKLHNALEPYYKLIRRSI